MKNWTAEMRRRVFDPKDTDELKKLHTQITRSRWRSRFHIQTVTGLLNDPNGFCFFNGKWHLFYQWFPYGAVHGLKHWYHVTSDDLYHWKNEGLALKPDVYADNGGCYTGSAFATDNMLYLAYTGNCRDGNYNRIPYQMMATMDKEGSITKNEIPIIIPEPGYTEHQRDPKIFRYLGSYYILLGAQDSEKKGRLLLYRSYDIESGWEFAGELKVRGHDGFGFMVECPDIEKIGDHWLLMFSPQGIEADGYEFNNKYNSVYMVGKMDFENLEFIPNGPMKEVDRGFDFYAPQCAFQREFPSKAVMTAWFGSCDYAYPPTDDEEWSGLITLPRELSVQGGKLLQKPARGWETLKGNQIFEAKEGSIISDSVHGLMPQTCIIELGDPDSESMMISLFSGSGLRGFEITYDKYSKRFVIDKGGMRSLINPEFGTKRTVVLENGLKKMLAFVDRSSVEIFLNDGEYVLSARIFPDEYENLIRFGGKNIDLNIYAANAAMGEDFVI
ncbi:MAG: sucrose-6-phosphate hydrolase [Solobacterium sp.]|nr:sucrose-6-phosphate hydrolase [Solobacterium sp.]